MTCVGHWAACQLLGETVKGVDKESFLSAGAKFDALLDRQWRHLPNFRRTISRAIIERSGPIGRRCAAPLHMNAQIGITCDLWNGSS